MLVETVDELRFISDLQGKAPGGREVSTPMLKSVIALRKTIAQEHELLNENKGLPVLCIYRADSSGVIRV